MAIKDTNKVKVNYTGTFDDGTVFDTSKNHGPLEFTVGANQVIKGFNDAVIGLEVGEKKKIRLEPKDAYGERTDELIKDIPKEHLKGVEDAKVGMTLGVTLPNGMQVPATITKMSADTVTIDLNHPMAGKTLNFEIEIVEYS